MSMFAMDNWGYEIKEKTAPVLIIIEGLTMYLSEADVQRFKEKSIDASNAKFTWGVKNGVALAELVSDFRFAEEYSLTEVMAAFTPVYKLLDKLPAVRNISNKIIVLKKGV